MPQIPSEKPGRDVWAKISIVSGITVPIIAVLLAFLLKRTEENPAVSVVPPARPRVESIVVRKDNTSPRATERSTVSTMIADETGIPVVPFFEVEVKPQPVNIAAPTYPDMARTAGIEGQALVEALVDTDGSVADARILKPSGNASLDQAAVDAALRSKFSPARQRDKAVRVWVSIPFRFTLQ